MNFTSLDHKDVWIKAAKTAVQAGVAAFLLSPDPSSKDALVAVGAAVVSAVWNYVLQVVKSGN